MICAGLRKYPSSPKFCPVRLWERQPLLSDLRDAGWIDGFSSGVISFRSALGSRQSEVPPCGLHEKRNDNMAWSTPEVREVCVGMEVTSYLSAEM